MKTVTIFCGIIGLTILTSCRQKPRLREATDQDLTVEVMQLKSDPDDDNTVSYQARLIPDKKMLDAKTKDEKNALYYQMDSCFYMLDGNKKIYAALVQPIANGISGQYEYLLEFEKAMTEGVAMIYQDKYINKKTYSLKLVEEKH